MPSSLIMRGYHDPTSLKEYEVYMKLMDTVFRDDPFTIHLNKKLDKEFATLSKKTFKKDTTINLSWYHGKYTDTMRNILSISDDINARSKYIDQLDYLETITNGMIDDINKNRMMYISEFINEQWHYARDMAMPINKEYKKYYALLVFCRFVVYEHRRDVYEQINKIVDSRKSILSHGDSNIFKKVERYNLNYAIDRMAVFADRFVASVSDFSKVKDKIEECFRRLI